MFGAVGILHHEGPVHEASLSNMVSSYNFSMALRLLVIVFLLQSAVYAQEEGGEGEGDGGGGEGRKN